jgi:hypothetical protein
MERRTFSLTRSAQQKSMKSITQLAERNGRVANVVEIAGQQAPGM